MERAEPVVRGLDDRVHAEHEGDGDEHGTEDVRSPADSNSFVGCEHASRQHGGHGSDGNVDEENPVPADGLRDEPARQQPYGGAG